MATAVHRRLHLASPVSRGADVKTLQAHINKQFEHLRIDHAVKLDGEFGPLTRAAAQQVGISLGAFGANAKSIRRGTATESLQQLIRGKLSRREALLAKARGPYRKKLRARFAKGAGERAIERAMHLVGVHEEPAESNWGPQVSKFIKFTGYVEPVYWCGCFACWVVVKLGGAKIPNRIRLGFAPYIVEDALAQRNGLTAIPVSKGRAGCLGSLWGGEHIVTLAEDVVPGAKSVKTIEGNTSPADGSQSNGGCVAIKVRNLSDFDSGIVALPAWS